MRLTHRRILVTGASSGIGRELSRSYAAEGAQVWAVARRSDALSATADGWDLIRPIPANLTDPAGRSRVASAISEDVDGLDVAVHGAGLLGTPNVPLELYPDADWHDVFEANVSAVHFLHRELAPLHHRAENPAVIGISSGVGRRGRGGWGMYAVSKFALEGWLEILADEWRDRGRVYSVNPGGTRTEMRAAAMPDEDPETLPSAEDVAPIFLRLAHAECPEPTGTKFEARDWIGRDPWP